MFTPCRTAFRFGCTMTQRFFSLLFIFSFLCPEAWGEETLVVIAANGLPKIDLAVLQRLYTGRIVSVGDQTVTPVNLVAGNALRQQFLEQFIGQNEEQTYRLLAGSALRWQRCAAA